MIPTASMADIAFLLIIFFMVTTVHEVDRTSVNLPAGQDPRRGGKGRGDRRAGQGRGRRDLVYKFSDGEEMSQVVVGARRTSTSRPRELTYADSTKQFVLKADGTVRFEKIDELLDAMREAGCSTSCC